MLGKLTTEIVEKMVSEFNKPENRKKLEDEIIDPLICYILDRLYPYIFMTAAVFILLLLIAILILVMVMRNKN